MPAAGRQPCVGTQWHPVGRSGMAAPGREPMQCEGRGTDEASRLGARPGRAEKQTAARRPTRTPPGGAPPPSPRGGTAHQPALPPSLADPPGAAKPPRRNTYTWGGCAGEERGVWTGGHRPPPRRRVVHGEPRRDPPSPLPPLPHFGPRDAGDGPRTARPEPPSRQGGRFPSPRKGRVAPRVDAAEPVRHAPPGPHVPATTRAATGK